MTAAEVQCLVIAFYIVAGAVCMLIFEAMANEHGRRFIEEVALTLFFAVGIAYVLHWISGQPLFAALPPNATTFDLAAIGPLLSFYLLYPFLLSFPIAFVSLGVHNSGVTYWMGRTVGITSRYGNLKFWRHTYDQITGRRIRLVYRSGATITGVASTFYEVGVHRELALSAANYAPPPVPATAGAVAAGATTSERILVLDLEDVVAIEYVM
jgi:hypothetical protein